MDRDEVVRDGQWASQLLADPRWIGAWEEYRLTLFALMESSKTDEGLIRGKLMLGVANDVRARFEAMITRGKVAAHEIKLEEERRRLKPSEYPRPWVA